jgi:hypothetical protein
VAREIEDSRERLRTGLLAIYGWYERNAALAGCVLRDAESHALTDEIAEMRFGPHFANYRVVLGAELSATQCVVLRLALSFFTWRTLVCEGGLKADAAVEAMVQAVDCRRPNTSIPLCARLRVSLRARRGASSGVGCGCARISKWKSERGMLRRSCPLLTWSASSSGSADTTAETHTARAATTTSGTAAGATAAATNPAVDAEPIRPVNLGPAGALLQLSRLLITARGREYGRHEQHYNSRRLLHRILHSIVTDLLGLEDCRRSLQRKKEFIQARRST